MRLDKSRRWVARSHLTHHSSHAARPTIKQVCSEEFWSALESAKQTLITAVSMSCRHVLIKARFRKI